MEEQELQIAADSPSIETEFGVVSIWGCDRDRVSVEIDRTGMAYLISPDDADRIAARLQACAKAARNH